MGWLNRKLAEIKELREIERQAYNEEKEVVDKENAEWKKQDAVRVGKERAQKKSKANQHENKVNKAIERGQKKARHNNDTESNNDMESKIKEMWGL